MPPSPSSAHWLSLVGSIWLQTINGPNADFPVYSSQLKDLKQISQVQLNFLAFASDAGKLFGWFSGVAALHLPLWLVASIGASFGLVGYGVQYLFLDSAGLRYWHLFLLTSLAGNGICWINTVCYLLCIRNFGSSSRVAVSLATSYLGLSAKVYTSLADSIPGLANSKAKAYLLLNAVVPMLVTVVVAPSLRVVELVSSPASCTDAAFLVMFAITLATGACAVVGSIGSTSSNELSSREHMVSLGVLLATPILIPLGLRIRESLNKIWETKRENRIHDLGADDIVAIDIADDAAESVKDGDNSAADEIMKPREEVGGLQLLKRLDFWLYFFSYMFSGTLGLVFLNNLGQIAESRRLAQTGTSTLVSLSSSFGFFGRLLPSFMDYYSAKSGYSISRTGSMASLMAPMAGAFFLLLNPSNFFLYLSTAVIGTCTGAITSVAVSATSELFGTKNFGVNHNVVVSNIPVGSLCFGYFSAYLYQRGAAGSGLRCIGPACYQQTFVLWGAMCAVGTLLCSVLYARSRSFAGRLPAAAGGAVRTSCLGRLANLFSRWW
ncbi:unnamed protein product [Urochloa humidicola]